MTGLDDKIGMDPVTDLAQIEHMRKDAFERHDYVLPIQDAEIAAGLTQDDVDAQLS